MADRAKGRVISLDVNDGRTRHYNVDNIAFYRAEDGSLNRFGMTLAILPVATTVIAGVIFQAQWWVFVIGSIVSLGLFGILLPGDKTKIQTVSDSVSVSADSEVGLEEEFKAYSDEIISISGSERTLTADRIYRYHFIPNNIVSIEEWSPPFRYITVGFGLVVGYIIGTGFGWGSAEAGALAVILGAVFGFAYLVWAEMVTGILVHLQGGEEAKFRLPSHEAERVINQFRDRPGDT